MFKNKWLRLLIGIISIFLLSALTACKTVAHDRILTNIPRSNIDQTKQVMLQLNNGMKVLIIEDPNATQSMVAINVGVGGYQDPANQMGISHFLEHAVFMGSKKYPQPNNMLHFTSNNSGVTNAITSNTNTVFFFSVQINALEEGLDRITDTLSNPLLQDQLSLAELKNVESEFQMRRYDIYRQYIEAMGETILNPKHPISYQPKGGNINSLQDKPNSQLMPELRKFHNKYYSSNIMNAVIYSKLPKENLIALANKYFNRIPNKFVKMPNISEKKIIKKQNILYLQSEDKGNIIELNFQVPKFKNNFAAFSYIDYLLQNKQNNTAYDILFKANLINGLTSSYEITYLEPEDEFTIHISLTDKGIQQQDLIVNTVFNYLELIKNKGIQQDYFAQLKQTLLNNFSQLKIDYSMDYIMLLSSLMQELPANHLYNYYLIPDHMKPEEVANTLGYITLNNANITYVSQKEQFKQVSKYYRAKYKIEPYSVERFSNQTIRKNFGNKLQLPPLNNYIATDFSINNPKDVFISRPKLLDNPYGILIYTMPSQYFQDDPSAYLSIEITSPIQLDQVKNYIVPYLMNTIFLKHYVAEFSKYDYANINWNYYLANGQFIFLQGIPQYMLTLSKDLLTKFKNFKFDSTDALKQAKTQFKQDIIEKRANMGALDSAFEVFDAFSYDFIDDNKAISVIEQITLQDLNKYQKSLLKNSKAKIFTFGNLNTKQTMEFAQMIQNILPSNLSHYPVKYFPDMAHQKFVFTKKIDNDNNAFIAAYYLSTKTPLENIIYARFLSQILDNAFFYRLRTKKQLGYTVAVSEVKLADGKILAFFVESPKATPKELYQHTQTFYQEALGILKSMPDNQFKKFKEGIYINLTGVPKNMNDEFTEYNIDFDMNNTGMPLFKKLANITKSIQKKDVIDYFEQAVLDEKGAVLLSEIIGNHKNDSDLITPNGYQRYRTLDELHKQITFSPINLDHSILKNIVKDKL